jgi:hypothetical protein
MCMKKSRKFRIVLKLIWLLCGWKARHTPKDTTLPPNHVLRRDTWVRFGVRFRPKDSNHPMKVSRPQLNAETFVTDNG